MASAPAAFKVHRLELFNFKSYLGKVSVGPFDDFTCIVGPNGSGKSNVMDALSFVLGASAATLRSSKLDDFVHKKAKKRECSVTLVMKSTAGDEKTFTRALNGNNSEYSVDGMRSNEKEFLGALRRLGLAARLSTFLVFQHEVDAVAQKKAKDLTDLIEQVSGSAELKAAYEACRKNLEEANKALMEAAVEKRGAQAELQQLKLHKVEAERFGDLQQKHAAERLSLAMAELFHIETQIHKHTEKLGEQTARLKELGSQDGATKALKQEYSTKHQQYLEELKRSRIVGAKHRDAKTTLERIRASVAHFTAKLARQQMQLTAAADTSKVRDKEVSRLKEQLDKVTKAWEMDQAKWAEEDAKSNKFASLSAKDLADYQQLRRDADIKTITERQSVETHKRERDALAEASKNVQLQLDRVDGTLGDFEAAVNTAQEKSTSISNRMQELEAEAKEVKAKLEEFKAAMQQSSLQKAKRDAEIKAIDEQLRELRYTKEENRHEQRVNEALESLKTLFPGVRGRFTDICTVKDKKKYAVAATVGFGANMDAIIVDTTATAMACVRYLKEQRIASLSFIPVNNVDGDEVTDDLRALGAGTIPLIDLLSFNPEDVRAIRFAVGRTLVCDSMHTARHVAYGNKDVRRKVVVLDGTVLLKNGSIQGGLAAVEARARKWDDRQYNELKQRREQALAAAGGADSDADEMRAKQRGRELQSRLEFIESSLKRLEEERAASQKRIDGAAADRKKLAKQKADLDKQLADLKAKMQAIEGAIADLTRTIAAEEDKIFRDFQKKVGVDKISDLEREMQRKEKARAEVKHQFEIVKHKLTTAIKAESERVGETSATDISAAVKATEKELATAKRDEVTQSALVEKDRVGFETSQKAVAALKSALDSLENRIREAGRATAAEANLYQAARKQLSLTEAATEGLRAQRRSIFQRCRMEEIDLPLADPSNVKRGRDTDLVPSEAAAVIRTSELFNPNSGPAPSAVGSSTGRSSGRAPESVAIDFSRLDKSLRQVAKDAKTFQQFKKETEDTIRTLADEMESLAPNLKVSTHLQSSELKVQNVATDVGQAKERSQKAFRDFSKVKQERTSRFMKTFQSIVEHVDDIYRELTMGTRASDVHGSAYLLLEDTEEPYRAGTRYHATPPTKRFMEMQQLSGGERTMAAMALLFAIHATSPTPFFVLDEVDAALDAGNVEKLAQYIRKHASPSSQYIVVSLKEQLYHKADSLIGVYKDTSRESSNVMSLDLSQMPQLQAAPL